jgi:acetate kinase
MSDAVLVLNSGSSSIKFAVFEISAAEPELICKGLLDEHDAAPRLTVTDAHGKALFEKRRAADDKDGNGLFADILGWLDRELAGRTLAAVAIRLPHRLVRPPTAWFMAGATSSIPSRSPRRGSRRWRR